MRTASFLPWLSCCCIRLFAFLLFSRPAVLETNITPVSYDLTADERASSDLAPRFPESLALIGLGSQFGGQHSTTTAQSMCSPCSCKAFICSCFLSCSFISNNVVKWLNISKSPQASKSCREKLRCLGSYRNALRPRNCHIVRCVYLRNRP